MVVWYGSTGLYDPYPVEPYVVRCFCETVMSRTRVSRVTLRVSDHGPRGMNVFLSPCSESQESQTVSVTL